MLSYCRHSTQLVESKRDLTCLTLYKPVLKTIVERLLVVKRHTLAKTFDELLLIKLMNGMLLYSTKRNMALYSLFNNSNVAQAL